jgi:hypothetical protein
MTELAIGACARHPDRSGLSACTRCGNFACTECLGPTDEADGRCEACRELDGRIPWERRQGPWWRRYADTVVDALPSPAPTFGQSFGGPIEPAAGFAALSSAIGFAPVVGLVLLIVPLVAVMPTLVPEDAGRLGEAEAGTLCALIPCAMVFYPSLSFLYFTTIGLVLHGLSRLFGGQATFQQSMRATYYSSVWEPVSALTFLVYVIPILGVLVVLSGYVASVAWRSVALSAFVEKAHRLPRSSAIVVAVLAAGFWQLLLVGSLVLVVGFAIWARFGADS